MEETKHKRDKIQEVITYIEVMEPQPPPAVARAFSVVDSLVLHPDVPVILPFHPPRAEARSREHWVPIAGERGSQLAPKGHVLRAMRWLTTAHAHNPRGQRQSRRLPG